MTVLAVAEIGDVNLTPDSDTGPEPGGEPRHRGAAGPPSTTGTEEAGGTLQEGTAVLSSASETASERTAAELFSATEGKGEEEGGASLQEEVTALCDASETDPQHVADASSQKSKRKVKFFVSVILNTTGGVPKQTGNVSADAVLQYVDS